MSIETRKLQLIERLAKLQDEKLLKRIEQLVNETTAQRYQRLMGDGSEESIKSMVREGMADWEAGRVYTTDELKARIFNKEK
ncbi:hypothetical protein BH09BAC1_BH09BAC1_25960 [soil metagenome]